MIIIIFSTTDIINLFCYIIIASNTIDTNGATIAPFGIPYHIHCKSYSCHFIRIITI
jgi:hypothetical protein